jgi:hypothetical protein
MKRFLRNNGLTLAFMGLFLVSLYVMSITGHRQYNEEQREHSGHPLTYLAYLPTGHFIEGVFENWESEFLQMGTYVLFTVFLFQRGSAESKPLDQRTPQDVDPKRQRYSQPPRAARWGGLGLALYMNSLAIALFVLFLFSFGLHALGGTWAFNQEQLAHQGQTVTMWQFMTTADFWYQSMQNWQSEFLAVAALAFLSIYLRQQGSPESKPVGAPHSHTGN